MKISSFWQPKMSCQKSSLTEEVAQFQSDVHVFQRSLPKQYQISVSTVKVLISGKRTHGGLTLHSKSTEIVLFYSPRN